MRIDAFGKVEQLYQNGKTKKPVPTTAPGHSDSLEISQVGKDYQIAKAAVKSAPDIRQDKVNDIKARIQNGTYNVSGKQVADAIVERYLNHMI